MTPHQIGYMLVLMGFVCLTAGILTIRKPQYPNVVMQTVQVVNEYGSEVSSRVYFYDVEQKD